MVAQSSAIYRTKTYTVHPGDSVNDQLPLIAVRVRVDNPGGMWVNIVDAEVTCPPFTIGWIVALPAIQIANITTTPPAGQTALVSAASQPATVIYSDDIEWVPSPGSPSNVLQNEFTSAATTVCAPFNSVINLTFPANSVKVDNPGGQWITVTIPGNVWTIPPWTIGVVIPLPTAQTSVTVSTTPPAGQTNQGGGNCATVGFTEQMLPASAGTPATIGTNNYSVFGVSVPPNTADNNPGTALGFSANSIIVQNAGGQWFIVSDGSNLQFVPPWTVNCIIPCPASTTRARYLSNSPPGGQFNQGHGNNTLAEWTSQILPASPGENVSGLLNNAFSAGAVFPGPNVADNNPGTALGFQANTIIVDNASGQWTDVFDGVVFRRVPPWTVQVSIPCPTTVANARYRTNSPPPGQQNTGAGDGFSTIIYTQQIIAPSQGIQLAPVLTRSNSASSIPNTQANQGLLPGAPAATFQLLVVVPAGSWYIRRVCITWAGPQAGSPTGYAAFGAPVNVTGNVPAMRLANNPNGGNATIDSDFGQDFPIVATAGASLAVTCVTAGGGNWAATTQLVACMIVLDPYVT